VRGGKLPREKDSVSFWWVWAGASLVRLALAAQNMGRTGPIPAPTPPGGDPGAALLVGAVVGRGERGRRDREREPRDAAACVGLAGVLPGRLAGGSVRVREVRVTTRG
jgi:hypothetical protein